MTNRRREAIAAGETTLGIELGSTRIKAVLIGKSGETLAVGGYTWENKYHKGIWMYALEDALLGLQECYADLAKNVKDQYDTELEKVGALGISGMMHGYLALDHAGRQLAEFRTWSNLITKPAAEELHEGAPSRRYAGCLA